VMIVLGEKNRVHLSTTGRTRICEAGGDEGTGGVRGRNKESYTSR